MTLSTIKREPWWFFLRHRICFYRKSRNMLDWDVATLKGGARLRITATRHGILI